MDPTKGDEARSLAITLKSEDDTQDAVPLSLLAAKLNAVQSALCNLAMALRGGPVGRRGAWASRVRSACDLRFREAHHSALTIVADLPPPQFLPGLDVGADALQHLAAVVNAATEAREDELVRLMPDTVARARTLKSLQDLSPREGDPWVVVLRNGSARATATLTPQTRAAIARLYREPAADDFEERTLVGELIEIRVDNRHHIALLVGQREIQCYYNPDMEGIVSQLVAGSIVDVVGRAQLNEEGAIRQIAEVFDVSTVDLSPFTLSSFHWSGRSLRLRQPVTCIPSYAHDLWVYECPRYGLHAFAHDRSVALSQVHEEMFFLWDGLAHELDDALTPDARTLRDTLIADIIPEESH